MTSSEATNSVFNITNENNNFSFTTPGYWSARRSQETITEVQDLINLSERNDIELHLEEVKKRGNQIKIEEKKSKLSDLELIKMK